MFLTSRIAGDYLKLCHDPVRDLRRWIAEDKKNRGLWRRGLSFSTKGRSGHVHTERAAIVVAQAHGLRGESLSTLRGWLDAQRQGRCDVDGVPARPRAGAGRDDGLRPVRGEGRSGKLAATGDTRAAFRSLAAVQTAAKADWPPAMVLELIGCKTPEDRQAWAGRWGAYLGGQVEREKRGALERPTRGRAADGGMNPS